MQPRSQHLVESPSANAVTLYRRVVSPDAARASIRGSASSQPSVH